MLIYPQRYRMLVLPEKKRKENKASPGIGAITICNVVQRTQMLIPCLLRARGSPVCVYVCMHARDVMPIPSSLPNAVLPLSSP